MTSLQAPAEIQRQIQDACTKMSTESGKALKELASAIKSMIKPSSVNTHIVNSKTAAKALKFLLKTSSCEDFVLLEVMPTAMVAAQLVEVITCVEKIAESVHELASLAHFKDAKPEQKPALGQPQQLQQTMQQFSGIEGPHHIITINGSSAVLPEVSIQECGTVVHVTNTDNIKGSKAKTNVREMRQYLSF